MSRLKIDNINFEEADFLVEVSKKEKIETSKEETVVQKETQKDTQEAELILNRAKEQAQNLLAEAQAEAEKILNDAQIEVQQRKQEIIDEAIKRADEIVENAKLTSQNENEQLITNSKEEIEQERLETIKNAYEEGHKDGINHAQEELEGKIADFDNFCSNQYEIRDKILKSANKDILNLIINISKKILLKELDAKTLDKIIKNDISMLEKKENITIILSEKYAKILYELQQKSLGEEIELNLEDFKQYENFNVIFNPDFSDDTIIVENLKERYDASISSQLDVIIRNIYDNSQNGKLDLEQYTEDETE